MTKEPEPKPPLQLRPTRPITPILKPKPPYESAGQAYEAPPPFEPKISSLGLMRNRTKESWEKLVEINKESS
jgi:hypothetical protein